MSTDQSLIEKFISNHPTVAIPAIEELEIEEIALLTQDLSIDQAANLLSKMTTYISGKVIEKVSLENAIKYIDYLSISSAELILRVCDRSIRAEILTGLPEEKSKYLNRAFTFSKDQVGAQLEPFVLTLTSHETIGKGLELVKNSNAAVKPHVFVLDQENKLVGYV